MTAEVICALEQYNPMRIIPLTTLTSFLHKIYLVILSEISFPNHFSSINIIAFHLLPIKGRERANGPVAKLYKKKVILGGSRNSATPGVFR